MARGLTHHPHVDSGPDLALEAHAIVRVGKALLSCGAETYRVRRSIAQVAAAVGVEWAQTQATLTEITVTLFKGATFRTQVGHVHSVGVDGQKLSHLESMVSDLTRGSATPQEIEAKLDAIDAHKGLYPTWFNAICAAIACAAATFLNNAWSIDVIGVVLGAFFGQFVKVLLLKRRINVYLATMVAALMTTVIYVGATAGLGWLLPDTGPHGAGLVLALIYLVPGFPLLNALLDLIKTDVTAGVSRLAYACMVLGSILPALLLASWIGAVDPTPPPAPTMPAGLWWATVLVASAVGVAGWSVLFNVRRLGAVFAGLIGLVGNGVRIVLLDLAYTPAWIAAAAGCFVVGVLATLLARTNRLAAATLCVPAALIMIPGIPAQRALTCFSLSDFTAMATNTSIATITIIGMAIGLSLARILSDKMWIFDQRRALDL